MKLTHHHYAHAIQTTVCSWLQIYFSLLCGTMKRAQSEYDTEQHSTMHCIIKLQQFICLGFYILCQNKSKKL